MSERFCLKWNDFQSVVSQSFSVLSQEEDFYDVTLVSDDQTKIPAHKLVLSASSHFFKSILKRNSHSHPLLYLSGVDSKSLGFVMDYIYQGEVQMYQHDLDNFLEIAQKLKVEGLLSTEQPKPRETKEYREKSNSDFTKEDIVQVSPGYYSVLETASDLEKKIPRTVRAAPGENLVFVDDMSEVGTKIEELIERREGMHYCRLCDYSSWKISHIKEHVEVHIEGLAYSCQFCDNTFRSRNILRKHLFASHRGAKPWERSNKSEIFSGARCL